ncbi:MAG TPA: hypothetical protein VGF96_00950 [Terracidiphilus sp.]|jgi:hypothetical protein
MATLEPVSKEAGPAREEILAFKEREQRLQLLIGELLQTNEELRLKMARLEAQSYGAQAEGARGII